MNGAGQEIEPWISADQSLLVFAAKGRADSLGSYDLYASHNCDGGWTEPKPLAGGVNSPSWDFGGRFTPDGKTFLFASNRPRDGEPAGGGRPLAGTAGYAELLARLRAPGNGLFDIYEIAAAELAIASPCAPVAPASH